MKTAKIGAMFLVSVLALAGIGAGYSMWSETLTIEGTVNTGSVDVDWSIVDFWDTEFPVPEKDVSSVTAEIVGNTLFVTILNAYPCIWYYVEFDIHCVGTVPVHFTDWVIDRVTLPASVELELTPITTAQLHQGDIFSGTLGIHLINADDIDESAIYTFTVSLLAHQYNETP